MFSILSKRSCTIRPTIKLSSANDFNLDKTKLLSSGKGLTLYHTVLSFNDPEEGFAKHCAYKEKMLITNIFSFFHNVFYSIKDKSNNLKNPPFPFMNLVSCKGFKFGLVQNLVVLQSITSEVKQVAPVLSFI